MTKINIQSPGGASLEDGNLRIKDGLPIDATLQTVSDVAENDSALQISTDKVKAESAEQCPLEVESTGTGGGIALLDNTTTDNESVGIGALGDNLCFRSGGVPEGNMRLTDTGRLTIKNDTSATTQNTVVIAASEANSGIALVPNGTGAITADIPDGTAAGGNARGTNAVDLQTNRTSNLDIASGASSVLVGGLGNRAQGLYSSILGGFQNKATTNWASVVGGQYNSSQGTYSFVGGGVSNTASTTASTISGGENNTASTGPHATIVGGQSNVSSGSHSVSGGNANTASGAASLALGGQGNIASAIRSVSLGGFSNTSSLDYAVTLGGLACESTTAFTIALGNRTRSYLIGQFSHSGANFTNSKGECQQSHITSLKESQLTTAATTILSLDGTGTANLIIPTGNNRMWNVKVSTIAVVTTITGTATGVSVGDSFMENRNLLFKRVGGTSSIVGVGTAEIIADTSMLTALMTYSAGASQELALTFTAPTFLGGGSLTIRVVSKVELVEVAY
jgi:hypothetical protein